MSGIKGINAGTANWNYKHGETKTRLFKIWSSMHERCERPKHSYYAGINRTTLKERLNNGWSVKDAVEKPIRRRTKGWRMSARMKGADDEQVHKLRCHRLQE